jgi:hypothetical protein
MPDTWGAPSSHEIVFGLGGYAMLHALCSMHLSN